MKNLSKVLVALLLIITVLFTSSCSILDLSALLNSTPKDDEPTTNNPPLSSDQTTTTTPPSNEDYMTKEEVEALIAGITQNITVNNNSIEVSSDHEQNLLAASKGLLSAVSIRAQFEITQAYGGFFGSTPTYKTETVTSGGAGVIYQLDKTTGSAYIITNYHVVYNVDSDEQDKISRNIKVYLYGQEYSQYYPSLDLSIPATYVGGSMQYDIAVLRVSGSDRLKASSAIAADFANSDEISVLQTVIAIGNPNAEGISATVGAVNVDSENLTMIGVDEQSTVTMRVIRIDAAVNGGNSGGGLFDDKGRVIGIVNAKIQSSNIDNIAYAIPSNVAKNVADNIIYYDTINPANDAVYKIILGVGVTIADKWSEYDSTTGKVVKLEKVAVSAVDKNSLADGKIQVGDIIKSISITASGNTTTHNITRTYNVFDAMLTARGGAGCSVTVTVMRGTEALTLTFDLTSVTPTSAK